MERVRTNRRIFLLGGAQVVTWALGCGGAGGRNDSHRSGPGGSSGAGATGARSGGDTAGGATAGGAAAGGATAGGAGDIAGRGGAGRGPTGGAGAGNDGGARCQATRTDIEGPFFTPESPVRSVLLEPGMVGTLLTLSGRVVDGDCRPLRNAVVDLWQADNDGAYDTVGFRLRGHVRVDDAGRYRFETIVPGRYLNGSQFRPAHLHVKVYVGASEVLTTQLYFEGDPFNDVDPWFSEETMIRSVATAEGHEQAQFDFVV